MTNNNILTFTTLNININYNAEMLQNNTESTRAYVGNVVTWLIRTAEKQVAQHRVEDIAQKIADSTINNQVNKVLTDDELESWDNYQAHIKLLDKMIADTSYTTEQWHAETDVDKMIFQLIALPNLPKTLSDNIKFMSESDFVDLMLLAEDYYKTAKQSHEKMQNALQSKWVYFKRGGNIFKGVKIKPNATDTKKFLALFVTGIAMDKDGHYDFTTLWNDKKKTKGVKQTANNFLALYITNRLNSNAKMLTDALKGAIEE